MPLEPLKWSHQGHTFPQAFVSNNWAWQGYWNRGISPWCTGQPWHPNFFQVQKWWISKTFLSTKGKHNPVHLPVFCGKELDHPNLLKKCVTILFILLFVYCLFLCTKVYWKLFVGRQILQAGMIQMCLEGN